MSPSRLLLAALLPALLAGCFSTRPLEGMDELESARTHSEWGDHEEALDLAEQQRAAHACCPSAERTWTGCRRGRGRAASRVGLALGSRTASGGGAAPS